MSEGKLTEERVAHVAKLARLRLSADELSEAHHQLQSILGYVDRLATVNTDAVPPTFHAVPLDAPLRADEVRPGLKREEVLRMAPHAVDGGFAVPKVLDV